MYRNLSVDHSLFYIEQHHLDTFLSIAEQMESYDHIVKEAALHKEDAWAIVFNAWLLLQPDEKNHILIQSVDKSLIYSSNFIIYQAVTQDSHFQSIKQRKDATPELLFLAALYLATGLNEWFLYVMKTYNISYMAEKNKEQGYFNIQYRTEDEIQSFLEDQALFIKATIQELKTDSFSKIIKKSCENAYFLYLENFVNQQV
ncbi:hypothetical protein [Lysinibacillus antri]|uniref:Uncharacterized protein n=1 Tax=Lysinibacillus antri TaxID=2498145 RepID=A0A3S0WIS6_9BACI|nr:hypothetical protein [Lysinibacillus antri]RUL57006.1 hypothetical protein EK386_00890 [Lysinibacillus antri]